jgi:serine/threonine protein kinase
MYEVFKGLKVRQLNQSKDGRMITWIATYKDTGQEIIIKQISSPQPNLVLSGFNNFQQKIDILRLKQHPNILKYLATFSTSDSFFILREYKKNVLSLSEIKNLKLTDIKFIAQKILSILVDLQESSPPLIHQNIKPENIFLDPQLNIYLTDFGFSEISTQSLEDFSTIPLFEGTLGFTSPEQFIRPTKSSDMYGLGATLICLIGKIKSIDLYKFVDRENKYRIHFQDLVIGLRPRFIEWLEKMVSPDQRHRFPNAKEALKALKPLYLAKYPKVELSQTDLDLKVTNLGEKFTAIVTINNPRNDTILFGEWLVAYHFNDPGSGTDNHTWIAFSPQKFARNHVECKIIIDTSKLMIDKVYQRELILSTNTVPNTCHLNLTITTPPIPIKVDKPPYFWIFALFFCSIIIGIMAGFVGTVAHSIGGLVASLGAWLFVAIVVSFTFSGVYLTGDHWTTNRFISAQIGGLFLWGLILAVILMTLKRLGSPNLFTLAISQFILIIVASFLAFLAYLVFNKFKRNNFNKVTAITTVLLTIGNGIFLGICSLISWSKWYIIASLLLFILPLIIILTYPIWLQFKLIKKYRQQEKNQLLIKP